MTYLLLILSKSSNDYHRSTDLTPKSVLWKSWGRGSSGGRGVKTICSLNHHPPRLTPIPFSAPDLMNFFKKNTVLESVDLVQSFDGFEVIDNFEEKCNFLFGIRKHQN